MDRKNQPFSGLRPRHVDEPGLQIDLVPSKPVDDASIEAGRHADPDGEPPVVVERRDEGSELLLSYDRPLSFEAAAGPRRRGIDRIVDQVLSANGPGEETGDIPDVLLDGGAGSSNDLARCLLPSGEAPRDELIDVGTGDLPNEFVAYASTEQGETCRVLVGGSLGECGAAGNEFIDGFIDRDVGHAADQAEVDPCVVTANEISGEFEALERVRLRLAFSSRVLVPDDRVAGAPWSSAVAAVEPRLAFSTHEGYSMGSGQKENKLRTWIEAVCKWLLNKGRSGGTGRRAGFKSLLSSIYRSRSPLIDQFSPESLRIADILQTRIFAA